jgi:hypothetical protein
LINEYRVLPANKYRHRYRELIEALKKERVPLHAGGICFRGGNKAFAPHRNRIERNRIVDSGPERGVAIAINGETEGVTLVKNQLRETRNPASRIGILIAAETRDSCCIDNDIVGFATAISDLRKR